MLAKLEWYRKGGCVSDRQWRDLLGVLKVQAGALDRGYLTEWASKLGFAGLARARPGPMLNRAEDSAMSTVPTRSFWSGFQYAIEGSHTGNGSS